MITGIGVHDPPESVFTIDWNLCSRSNGIRVHDQTESADQVVKSIDEVARGGETWHGAFDDGDRAGDGFRQFVTLNGHHTGDDACRRRLAWSLVVRGRDFFFPPPGRPLRHDAVATDEARGFQLSPERRAIMTAVCPFLLEPTKEWIKRTHPRPEYIGAAGADDLTDKSA